MRYLLLTLLGLAASFPSVACGQIAAPESVFSSLCGNTYTGVVTSTDEVDADWRADGLTLGPVRCLDNGTGRIELPLAVGSNKSRTWIITGSGDTTELRHQHVLDNGQVDPVSDYGGMIRGFPISAGKAIRMDFPADAKTVGIFKANALDVSITNVWTLELIPDQMLSYELNRENRNFRAEFDLTQPR